MSNVKMKYPGFRDKALTLSYDDGCTSDIKMIEILDKYGIKCTFNINTMCFDSKEVDYPKGSTGRMTKNKALELYKDCGHEVALHTLRHQWLANLPTYDAITEIIDDRKNIEEMFGTVVRGMAYPYGNYNDDVIDILRLSGIVYARTTISTNNFNIPEQKDWLKLPATCHFLAGNLNELTDKFVNNHYCNPWLFYVWGHSYEFERGDKWEYFEEFCKKVGNNDSIWYATNIQIFDYILAYKALQFSANMTRVYNPTATEVYFSINGADYSVKPGELLQIK